MWVWDFSIGRGKGPSIDFVDPSRRDEPQPARSQAASAPAPHLLCRRPEAPGLTKSAHSGPRARQIDHPRGKGPRIHRGSGSGSLWTLWIMWISEGQARGPAGQAQALLVPPSPPPAPSTKGKISKDAHAHTRAVLSHEPPWIGLSWIKFLHGHSRGPDNASNGPERQFGGTGRPFWMRLMPVTRHTVSEDASARTASWSSREFSVLSASLHRSPERASKFEPRPNQWPNRFIQHIHQQIMPRRQGNERLGNDCRREQKQQRLRGDGAAKKIAPVGQRGSS